MSNINFMGIMKSAKKFVIKYGPEILTGIGITGMITTTVMAVKVTPKALRLIDKAKEEKGKELTKSEIVKTTWTCYIPPVITAFFSTACLLLASKENHKRNAALATAYAISEAAITEYKNKVIETIGEKKEQDIQDGIAKDTIAKHPVNCSEVVITEKGNTLCYDITSGRYFKSDIDKLKKSIIDLNYRMMNEMYISLNDLYSEIGLNETSIGDELGWNINAGPIKLRLSSQLTENDTPCIVIKYEIAPTYGYRDY